MGRVPWKAERLAVILYGGNLNREWVTSKRPQTIPSLKYSWTLKMSILVAYQSLEHTVTFAWLWGDWRDLSLACIAGGTRERASGEAASEIFSRLRHRARSRLRYQNKSTRALECEILPATQAKLSLFKMLCSREKSILRKNPVLPNEKFPSLVLCQECSNVQHLINYPIFVQFSVYLQLSHVGG